MSPDPSPALTGQEVVITRTFAAPRALVWRAWTDPGDIRRWWGPTESGALDCEVELRVGGRLRLQVCGPDGGLYPCHGTYREIVPMERLVLAGETDEAHPCGAGLPSRSLVTVTFAEDAGQTTVTLHTRFASAERRTAAEQAGYRRSWEISLERLAERLSSSPVGLATAGLRAGPEPDGWQGIATIRRLDTPTRCRRGWRRG